MTVILVLCGIVAYIYAIIGINLFASYTENTHIVASYQWSFSNLIHAMFSLFQLATFDNWATLAGEIAQYSGPAVAYGYIITWIWLGGFIFRNVFIGVIVTHFQDIQEEIIAKEEEFLKQKKFDRLRKKLNKELNAREKSEKPAAKVNKMALPPLPKQAEIEKSALMGGGSPISIAGKTEYSFDMNSSRGQFENLIGARANQTPPAVATIHEETPYDFSNAATTTAKIPEPSLMPAQGGQFESLLLGKEWEKTVVETMQGLIAKQETTLWPRDTLFKYLTHMENLQENLREYEELQLIASNLLLELND